MTLLLILVGTAVLVLLAAWRALRWQMPEGELEELMQQVRPVDLDAFRNLLDPYNEEYLRQHISPKDFRTWQKLRTKAAMEYLNWISQNAVILLAMGEMAARSSDASIASRGKDLANVALWLRINSLLALGKLYAGLIYPQLGVSINSIFDRYAKTHDSYLSLRFAQHRTSFSKGLAAL